jgi:hypothetical protein
LPTGIPIFAGSVSRPAVTAAVGASAAWVASSGAGRLRARSSGQHRVAARDQPFAGMIGVGELGQVGFIEQRRVSSNSDSGGGPWSAATAAIAGARTAVNQPGPPSVWGVSIRALVIIPRSPTRVSRLSPNRSRTVLTAWGNAVGSAVLPGKSSIATGRARRVGERPMLDPRGAPLTVAGVPDRGQRATLPDHPRTGQLLERQPALG